ncbi:hypothetical protein R3P38DRAFT_2905607, partial [Favolaschia claudopus]
MSRARARALDPSRSINVSSPVLIIQLNRLLVSLKLPISVDSHSQLTPSLLICVLESLLSSRLPIPDEHREKLFSSTASKIHCMKIFLGVMQADILKQDVGLSNVDPRRLARGDDDETIFVARLLCWYGRRRGLISRSELGQEVESRTRDNESGSPSTLTTRLTATETSHVLEASDTSISSDASTSAAAASPASVAQEVVVGPRCIHEVPSPSLVLSPVDDIAASAFAFGALPGDDVESHLFAPSSHTNSSVRYEGCISLVDEDAEIASFEARRGVGAKAKGKGKQSATTQYIEDEETPVSASALAAAQTRRMELLQRKADILEELAQLRLQEYKTLRVVP